MKGGNISVDGKLSAKQEVNFIIFAILKVISGLGYIYGKKSYLLDMLIDSLSNIPIEPTLT